MKQKIKSHTNSCIWTSSSDQKAQTLRWLSAFYFSAPSIFPIYKAHQNFCGVFGFGLKWRLVEKQTKTFLHNQDLNSPHTQLQFRLLWIMSSLFSFPETRNLCAERDKATDSANSSQGGTRGITKRFRVMFIRTAPKNRKRKLVRRQNDLTRPTLAEFPRTAADVDQLMRNRR